ncbi:MAG: LysR family transcriptional regulator [Clostridia bacterium]|nr:LysR family transcriptional regulator [Clostridia bacterium]
MNLSFELYRAFCKVVECKSISKAADELFISQSAVTQSMQKLEKILGEKLFFRNRGGIELTDLGSNLYEYINGSVKTLENAEEIFANYSSLNKGVLRIGGGNTLISNLLLQPICEFSRKYPNVKISIHNGFTDILIERVSKGELDIVTLNLPYKGKIFSNVEIVPLKDSSYCLFASKEYMKTHSIKKIEDIQDCKLILPSKVSSRYKIFEEALKQYDCDFEASFEVASSMVVKKLVLNHVGIGFCESESIDDIKGAIKIIKDFQFDEDSQGIAILHKNSQSKATREFLKLIK